MVNNSAPIISAYNGVNFPVSEASFRIHDVRTLINWSSIFDVYFTARRTLAVFELMALCV
jgi:hypothetical protein